MCRSGDGEREAEREREIQAKQKRESWELKPWKSCSQPHGVGTL